MTSSKRRLMIDRSTPSGIYGIYCLSNNRWYVGQSKNIVRRNKDELRELTAGICHNKHLQRAWDKYGSHSFLWVVLQRCPEENLDQTEVDWIERLKALDSGFNLTAGGGGVRGYRHTEEWKAQASIRNSNGNSPRKGRPLSAESKARMRMKALGANSPKAKAVQQMTRSGILVETFGSISEAERATGVCGAHISEVCLHRPKRKTAGGYIWRYVGGSS